MRNKQLKLKKPKYGSRDYAVEKIEAYNVAIETLRLHEPADGDPTGIARKFRLALAEKLDKEIDRWYKHYREEE